MTTSPHGHWNNRIRIALLAFAWMLATIMPATPSRAQEDPAGNPPAAAPAPARGSRSDTTAGTTGGATSAGGGAAVSRAGRSSAPAALPAPGEGPTASFAATIYEVRMPADQIGRLDIDALTTASAGTAGFEKALAGLGTAHVLYYVNQSVRLAADSIRIEAQTPFVTNSQITNRGDVVNSVSYTVIGATFTIAGKAKAAGSAELDLSVQVGGLIESPTAISENVNSPYFRTATMARKGPVQTGRPFVLVSADGASLDLDGKAVAYIVRVTLGPLQ